MEKLIEKSAINQMIDFLKEKYQWFIEHSPEYGIVPQIIKKAEELASLESQSQPTEACPQFFPDGKSTSATKCQFCGREKWEHNTITQPTEAKSAEEALKELWNDLWENAYNPEYHNYSYKEANQIIRKHFEKFALSQPSKETKTIFEKLNEKGLIDKSYVAMDKVNEICDKAEKQLGENLKGSAEEIKTRLLQLLQDFSEQYGDTYEDRCIYDNSFSEVVNALINILPIRISDLKTAEEIKEKYASISKDVCEGYQHEDILKAMIEFASLRQSEVSELTDGEIQSFVSKIGTEYRKIGGMSFVEICEYVKEWLRSRIKGVERKDK
jgi:hypothetical protein